MTWRNEVIRGTSKARSKRVREISGSLIQPGIYSNGSPQVTYNSFVGNGAAAGQPTAQAAIYLTAGGRSTLR